MHIYYEKIPLVENSAFYYKELRLEAFDAPRHFHPEFELMVVVRGRGKRFVGDNIDNFDDKDVVLVGSNLPHYWYTEEKDKDYGVHAHVIQFKENFVGEEFLGRYEMADMRKLFSRASQGIKFSTDTYEEIIDRIEELENLKGFDRVIRMLSILNVLSKDKQVTLLSSPDQNKNLDKFDCEKINKVYDYILDSYTEDVDLTTAASLVNMKNPAFCHYFKKRTRKNFSQFVNEIRIGQACKLIVSSTKSISQICYECGFKNLSNFNRRFKEMNKISPVEYRKQFYKNEVLPKENFISDNN